MAILDSLREVVAGVELFDTHEHLLPEADWLSKPPGKTDFSHFFSHYASVDLLSAGMSPKALEEIRSEEMPLTEKWKRFEPFWERARNTAYCRAVSRAIRDLFELPDLNRDTCHELSVRMREHQKPGWYRKVLKDRARIYRSVVQGLDGRTEVDRELFAPAAAMDQFVLLRSPQDLEALRKESGFEIASISALTGALSAAFERRVHEKTAAVKISLAYYRTLAFEDPPRPRAEEALERLLKGDKLTPAEARPLEDFMLHQVIQRAIEHHLPVQIHTGMQEGSGNYLSWTNPVLLSPILMKYKEARFDLFHAGYPYCYELGVLAKMFPSVHPDLCWTHIISPLGARRALSEWLELMPATKILGFGGDYLFVEGIYAHAMLARENVARVLARKVEEGYFSPGEAEWIARRILLENGKEFFGMY